MDTLDSLKIQSTAGSSYLNDRPYLEREKEELESHPLLPYGLILTRREADKIHPDMLKETLLKSAVPIFIREEMAAADQASFMLLTNQGPQMVLQPDRFLDWKNGIQTKLKEQEQELQDSEAYLSKLKSVYREFERLFQADNTKTIIAKLNNLALHQNELMQKISGLDTEIKGNEDTLTRIGRELVESEALSLEHEQRATALRTWIDRTKKQELDHKEKQKTVEQKGLLSKKIAGYDLQLEHLKAQMDSLGGQREKWLGDTKYSLFPRMQHWFPEIVFPTDHLSSDDQEVINVELSEQNLLLQQLSTVESLQQSLTQNELEIRIKAAQIISASENLADIEDQPKTGRCQLEESGRANGIGRIHYDCKESPEIGNNSAR